ncbi:MAG: BsuPI-related putative proteinase inhibitor [bacterium]|jgi:hypothetical protein
MAGICLAAAFATISCGSKKGREGEAAPVEQVGADSVTAYVDLREMGYAALEPIPMKLVVRNETERTLCFTFPTGQRFDFIVTKVKEPVWAWSEERTFAGAVGRLAVAPEDSVVYEHTWDGRLAGGRLPRLGRYWVKGALMTAPPIQTGTRKFAIVD